MNAYSVDADHAVKLTSASEVAPGSPSVSWSAQLLPASSSRPLDGVQLTIHPVPANLAELAQALRTRSELLGARVVDAAPSQASDSGQVLQAELDDQTGRRLKLCLSHWAHEEIAQTLTAYLEAASGISAWLGKNSACSETLGCSYLEHLAASLALSCAIASLTHAAAGQVCVVKLNLAATAVFMMSSYLAIAHAQGQRDTAKHKAIPAKQLQPLQSADQQYFELEILHPDHWRNFWQEAGLTSELIATTWPAYLQRYTSASFVFPEAFHTALRQLPYSKLERLADQHAIHICRHHTLAQLPHLPRFPEWEQDGPWQWTLQAHSATTTAALTVKPQLTTTAAMTNLWGQPEQAYFSPLQGIQVIESCRLIQGPLAAQILQRMGANVIKIEAPGGDPMRAMPPTVQSDLEPETSAHFLSFNYAKTRTELDLRTSDGRQKLLDLTQSADIFLHNWAPQRARDWHLEAADLRLNSPQLIYACAAGCGAEWQAQDTVGTDFMIQAYSGLASLPSHAPRGVRLLTLIDVLGAASCAEGIVAALYARQRQNKIYSLVSSMAGAAHLLLSTELAAARNTPPASVFPLALVVLCEDAEVLVCCADHASYLALLNQLQLPVTARNHGSANDTLHLPGLSLARLSSHLQALGLTAQTIHHEPAAITAEPGLATYFKQRQQHLQVLNPWSIQILPS